MPYKRFSLIADTFPATQSDANQDRRRLFQQPRLFSTVMLVCEFACTLMVYENQCFPGAGVSHWSCWTRARTNSPQAIHRADFGVADDLTSNCRAKQSGQLSHRNA